jgi:hypothetical protein
VWRNQGFNFCDNCILWDAAVSANPTNKRIKRDSRTFVCTAGHSSFAYPTALLPSRALWLEPRRRDDRSVDDDGDGSVDGAEDGDRGDSGEDEADEEDLCAITVDLGKQLHLLRCAVQISLLARLYCKQQH